MNTIRYFQPEYNVRSFFRDLPLIRERTFKERTIKHAFRDAGMWPVSFKAVKAKINEYGKKQKPKGENILTGKEQEPLDFELPDLLSPSLYTECQAMI